MSVPDFANRDGWIWLDGSFVPWRSAKFHVLTHGLHYASSVFEGIRAYSGRAFKLQEHMDRFMESARLLGYELPFSTSELRHACRETLTKNGLGDAYIRPVAWRGSDQISVAAPKATIHVAIASWRMPAYFHADASRSGIRLATSAWRRQAPFQAPLQAKAAGLYMAGTLAKHQALEAGYDDALMLDWEGYVAEASAANIFAVIDGVLTTPTGDRFLDGITRKTVIQLAHELQIPVTIRRLSLDELIGASEVFLTGTAAELTPVVHIDKSNFTPAIHTSRLIDAYRSLVNSSPLSGDRE